MNRTYQVSGEARSEWVDFAPHSTAEEVIQNVRTLLTTSKYSVPMDRELGIDNSYIDRPLPAGMAKLRVQIVEEIQRSEPRAKIKVVSFKPYKDAALQGKMYPVVDIEIIEEGVST